MAEKTGTKDRLEVQVDRLLGVLLNILPAGPTIVDACSLILYFQIAQLVFRNMM